MAHLHPAGRLVLAGVLALTACSKNPDVQKREYFERGNKYADAKKYREAIIEYRNAVQIDPKFGEARYGLAKAYEQVDDHAQRLSRVRARGGPAAGRQRSPAEDRNAAARPGAVRGRSHPRAEGARCRPEECRRAAPGGECDRRTQGPEGRHAADRGGDQAESRPTARPTTPSGNLQMASGNPAEAERAFKRAIELAPSSDGAAARAGQFLLEPEAPGDRSDADGHAADRPEQRDRSQRARHLLSGDRSSGPRPSLI